MSYSVSYVTLSVSSPLWLGAGGNGKGMSYDSRRREKIMKNVFVTLFKSPDPAIDSHLKINSVPDSLPLSSSSQPPTASSRPALARASTSATLIDTDFIPPALPPVLSTRVAESRSKPSTDSLQSTELVDRLRNHLLPRTPPPSVEDGNLDQDAPVVNIIAPPSVVRRRKKRATRKTVRWAPDVIEREIQANRPVTGLERLERFRRLGLTI
ncbi:hypothetical protein LXA43DRAFT_1183081 [Ganoderma leucocontextum]|nr:hypothetical protein LXA43DRAFT_1183081 [Ganoderma leucocontextum]